MMSMLSNLLLYILAYYDLCNFLYLLSSSWSGLSLFFSHFLLVSLSRLQCPGFKRAWDRATQHLSKLSIATFWGPALGFIHYPCVFFPIICFISTSFLSSFSITVFNFSWVYFNVSIPAFELR